MISNEDKDKIRAISKKYNVKKVLVFGSSANPHTEGNDIDLAWKALMTGYFLNFAGNFILACPNLSIWLI